MTTDFILGPGEFFIECPYNKSHLITNARLNTHLEKCRKAYKKTQAEEGRLPNIQICRFNANHHFPAPEIKFHEDQCPDSFSVVRHLSYHNSAEGSKRYEERRKQDSSNRRSPSPSTSKRPSHSNHKRDKEKPETKPPQITEWGLEDEDWEADCAGDVPGYDPEIKLKTEVVIYNPAGLTKSERKKFRNEVREKAAEQSLKGEPVEFPTANTFDVKPDVKPDIKGLKIEVGRSSPLEPGEIDDNDVVDNKTSKTSQRDDGKNRSHSGSRNGDHHRDVKYERRESHSDRRERDIKYDPRDSHSDHRRESSYDRRDSSSKRRDSHSDRRDTHSDRRDSRSERRDTHYERRDSRGDDRTSSSSRLHASSSKSKSSYSKPGNSSTKQPHVDDGPYSDNDDFAGYDPYA